MDVVGHEPHSWFLLREGDDLFLDVNCSEGAYGFTVLLPLSAAERDAFEKRGRAALTELAAAVQDSAPAARDSTSPYRDRDLEKVRGHDVMGAVYRWRGGGVGRAIRRVGGAGQDAPVMIELRDFAESDADSLYEWMRDPVSVRMAAFTAKDPDDRGAFDAWLARVRANPTVIQKMIWVDGALVGSISTFEMEGEREVTYWLERTAWGRGIASRALATLLELDTVRPLSGRVAAANVASAKVLERAGFVEVGRDRGFANGVGAEVEEIIFRLG